ncbi:MAG: hypothetical protein H8D43_03290 [Chloroflexi bacterium]|nr:hypothetical protein [Chloroflexota bacterium]
MPIRIEYAVKRLEEVKGELTAAVLFIPVSLTFQDLAHSLVQDTSPMRDLVAGIAQLSSFLLLSVISVSILSLGILHLTEWDFWKQLGLVLNVLFFVGTVVIAGGLAIKKACPSDSALLQAALAFSCLPGCIVAHFFDWANVASEQWVLAADAFVLFCVLLLAWPM